MNFTLNNFVNFYLNIKFNFFFTVCVGVLNKFIKTLSDSEKSSIPKIEEKFKQFCLSTKKSEERFVSIFLLQF